MDIEQPPSSDRQRLITDIQQRDHVAFQDWITKTNPFQELPSNPEAARYLIPPGIWDVVGNPERVDLVMTLGDPESIEFFVVEHMDQPLTNIDSMKSFEKVIDRLSRQVASGRASYPPLPADVDPFHWNEMDKVLDGKIQITDKIYHTAYLQAMGDELNVVSYGDREELRGKGVATSFYQRLREVAKTLGFKYVAGQNIEENSGFFKQKLGRMSLDELPEDLQEYFWKHHGSDLEDEDKAGKNFTVDFLNPEDKPKI